MVDISELRIAKTDGIFQHGLEHWLRITRVAADNPKHLRGRALLLQGLP
jgi:hypothetical protein